MVKVIILSILTWNWMNNVPDVFVENTQGAIETIVDKHYPENYRHFVRTDKKKTRALASYFVEASLLTDLPVEFLLANAWRESHLKQTTRGAIGELGVMQIHGRAIGYCRASLGRKVRPSTNVRDNILCGAHWLKYSVDSCDGNYRHGIHKYMSGKHCKIPKNWKLYKRANIRMELMEEFENYFYTGG